MDDDGAGNGAPLKSPTAVVFVLGVIGIAAPEIGTEGEPQTLRGWGYLILGAAAGSLAIMGGVEMLLNAARLRPIWIKIERPLRVLLFGTLVLSLTVACGVGVARAVSVGRGVFRGCTAPTELSVVADAENMGVARRLAEGFERDAAQDDGCATVNVTVYEASAADVQAALLEHWSAVDDADPESPHPLRDVGPRPDVWLPSSTAEVDRLLQEARGRTLPVARASVYAGSRLVLGVSPEAAAGGPGDGTGWHAALSALVSRGVPVVRPESGVSSAGRLAAATLLRAPDPRTGAAPTAESLRRSEQQLAASARTGGYPFGDAGAVLGRYAARSCGEPHAAAFVLPRHLLLHPDLVGAALADRPGDRCQPQSDRALRTVDPTDSRDIGLPAVVLAWDHPAGPSSAATQAEAFRRWLLSHAGQDAAGTVGLEPYDRLERRPAGRLDVTGATRALDPDLLRDVERGVAVQRVAGERVRILVALDTSLSMSTALPAAAGTVGDLLDRLGESDEVGLLTFGRETATRVPLLPAGSPLRQDAHRRKVLDAAGRERPGGQTPLWPAVGAGIEALVTAPGGGVARPMLVVVTDGEITTGAMDPAIARQAQRTGARVIVVVVGSGSCAPLAAQIAKLSAIRCARSVGEAAAAIWRDGNA